MALKKYVQPSKTLSVSSLQTRDGNDDAHLLVLRRTAKLAILTRSQSSGQTATQPSTTWLFYRRPMSRYGRPAAMLAYDHYVLLPSFISFFQRLISTVTPSIVTKLCCHIFDINPNL